MPPAKKSIMERVQSKVELVDDHWVWKGQTTKRPGVAPRPIMAVDGSKVGVRIALWRETLGSDPGGPLVETCEQPLCVNPAHTDVGFKGGNHGKEQPPDWSFIEDQDFMAVVRRGCVRSAQRRCVDPDDLFQEVVLWTSTHGYIFEKGRHYATKSALLQGGKRFAQAEWSRDVLGPTGDILQFEAILSR